MFHVMNAKSATVTFYEVSSRTLSEDRLQHTKDKLDFIVVSLDRAGNLLAMVFLEPRCLVKV